MGWGDTDGDNDSGFDVGMGTPTPEELAEARVRRVRVEADYRKMLAAPIMKAQIELSGPDLNGLWDAENGLMMAGWPPEKGGPTSGSYDDPTLRITVKWKLVK